MKKREIPVMNVGISLIILIFMNICLAAFAVLSLENAISDYSLSKKTATHTTQYYNAVNKVQEQLAEKNQELREKAIAAEKAESKKTKTENTQKKIKTQTAGTQNIQKEVEAKTTETQNVQKKVETKTTETQNVQKKVETKTTETQNVQKKVETKTTQTQNAQKKTETKAAENQNIQSQIKLTETVSKSQQLVVTLQLKETQKYPQYYIAKWQLCSSENWQADDSLDVYQSGK